MEKKVLFRARDGFDVFEGNMVWEVKNTFVLQEWGMYSEYNELFLRNKKPEKHIFFRFKENAENYIRLNKPRFSETDVKIALRQHNIPDHFVETILTFINERKDANTDI